MPNISPAQAKQMIRLYETNKSLTLKSDIDPDILALSETFDKSEIEELLNQKTCVSLRVYYGMSEDLYVHAILVGVDSNGNDILATNPPIIIEEGVRCPPLCKANAGLN